MEKGISEPQDANSFPSQYPGLTPRHWVALLQPCSATYGYTEASQKNTGKEQFPC